MKIYRQGDVILEVVGTQKIADASEKPDLILARGETTGHAHRITEGQARLYAFATGVVILKVLSEYARLYHEEHEDIILPMGDYQIRQQREWDWQSEVNRNVSD